MACCGQTAAPLACWPLKIVVHVFLFLKLFGFPASEGEGVFFYFWGLYNGINLQKNIESDMRTPKASDFSK